MDLNPEPEGFGSNLNCNISSMPQNFSHMYLHMSSNRYISKFYKQSSEWTKLMTINSTAQPTETHGKLAGIFPYVESFIVDQAAHTLRSAAILFLRDGAKGTQSRLCFCTPAMQY